MPQQDRKVIYAMIASLDGFIAGPNDDLEWTTPDEELHRHFNEWEKSDIDVHLYGRVMYENMAAFWPTAGDNPDAHPVEVEYAQLWNAVKKVVFSTTLDEVGENTILVKDNIAEAVAELKAQPGKHMGLGGASIAKSFRELGLIDEYHVYIQPFLLGSGKPMFKDVIHVAKLQHMETQTFNGGTVLLKYRPVRSSQ